MEMYRRPSAESDDFKMYSKNKMDAQEYDALLGMTRTSIPYPKSVFFIFVTEFCERFSYYGMRTVLTLYLRNALAYSDSTATVIYHIFVMLCYTTPLFGAYIADSVLGKFRTILYLSIIYALGNVVLSTASIPVIAIPHIPFSLIGLGLIAIGTGGIKPCVSAFGGAQFQLPGQEKSLEQYFFIFYFLVNLGSVMSTFLTPLFRKDVSCFGSDTCYPLAFGVPAVLMITSLVIFVAGKPFYKMHVPEKNVGVQIIKSVTHALKNKRKYKGSCLERNHWLDYADDEYDTDFLDDVKRLLSIFVLFIPLPIFWSLFDQQGSQWTLQATRMNGDVFGWFTIKPDQMQLVNSLLVVLSIPFFERVLYPLLAKCNILKKPLQRMTLGGLLASLSFVIAAVVELQIEPTYPVIPGHSEAGLNFVNTLPCPLRILLTEPNGQLELNQTVYPFENVVYNALPAPINYSVSIQPRNQSESCLLNGQPLKYEGRRLPLTPKSEQSLSIFITVNENNEPILLYPDVGDDLKKSLEGNAKIRVMYDAITLGDENSNFSVILSSKKFNYEFRLSQTNLATNTTEVEPGRYLARLKQIHWDGRSQVIDAASLEIEAGTGGSYLLTLFHEMSKGDSGNSTQADEKMMMKLFTITNANTVPMLLLLPQYIVITLGEILFALTGYDFSFSQAPNSMKTTMQSVWLLTNAFGNLIVIGIVESHLFKSQSMQFFFFAGLMFISFLVFAFMADRYKSMKLQPSPPVFKSRSALPPPTSNNGFTTADTNFDD